MQSGKILKIPTIGGSPVENINLFNHDVKAQLVLCPEPKSNCFEASFSF
jgi:hypothetical protein